MTDKLNEGDVIDLDAINKALELAKTLRIKPVDVNGGKYYFWIQDKHGAWIPSDDPGARDALLGVMGEHLFYEGEDNA